MPQVLATIIRPKRANTAAISREIRKALMRRGRKVTRELEATTEHWGGDKPKFGIIKTRAAATRSRDVFIIIGVKGGSEHGKNKWKWLDEGTAVRRAVMSPQFVRKTRPGTTATRSGRPPFAPVARGKNIQRPGIEERGWTIIIERRQHTKPPTFGKQVSLAVRKGLQAAR